MKEDTRWKIIAGLILVTLSLALYTAHFFIFSDAHHLLIFLVGDIAFIPLEVLIVTLVIDQMLQSRERQQRMEKLNMVIGTFFSTMGISLLSLFSRADPDIRSVTSQLAVKNRSPDDQIISIKTCLTAHQCTARIEGIDLVRLRDLLVKNEEFLLRVVENPMVFEHESFTDLILAVSHLTEELKARGDLSSLPPSDLAHIEGDIHRVYGQLVPAWVRYMEYLKTNYPYLFSLALRKNPFNPDASVIVGS